LQMLPPKLLVAQGQGPQGQVGGLALAPALAQQRAHDQVQLDQVESLALQDRAGGQVL